MAYPNYEGDEGPAVSMFGGIPAFGGHGLAGTVERSATLTAKDGRMDIESETFFVQPPPNASSEHQVVGTLQANGKAAGSATQQDAEAALLVVHGTQDPGVSAHTAFALGRNYGQENAVFAIQAGALRTNPNSGPDGVGVQADQAYTLEARAEVQAVFDPNQVTSKTNRSQPQPGICHTLPAASSAPAAYTTKRHSSTGQGQPTVACRGVAQTITSNYGKQVDNTDSGLGPNVVAYSTKLHNTSSNQAGKLYEEYTVSLDASSPPPALLRPSEVRRLMPLECERLQGFPDGHTAIPWRGKPASECPDGPLYKAIGNSKAVPVVRWLGLRLLKQITPSPYGR